MNPKKGNGEVHIHSLAEYLRKRNQNCLAEENNVF